MTIPCPSSTQLTANLADCSIQNCYTITSSCLINFKSTSSLYPICIKPKSVFLTVEMPVFFDLYSFPNRPIDSVLPILLFYRTLLRDPPWWSFVINFNVLISNYIIGVWAMITLNAEWYRIRLEDFSFHIQNLGFTKIKTNNASKC